MSENQIARAFSYQIERPAIVRACGQVFAAVIATYCPESPEKAEALRLVQEAMNLAQYAAGRLLDGGIQEFEEPETPEE